MNPFNLKLRGFMALSPEQTEQIFEKAQEITEDFVAQYFAKNPGVDWIVIAVSPENIIAKGMMAALPDETELTEMATIYHVPVFTYVRSHGKIEQIDPLCDMVVNVKKAQIIAKELTEGLMAIDQSDEEAVEKYFQEKFDVLSEEIKSLIVSMLMIVK